MTKYRYVAKDAAGNIVKGRIEAEDELRAVAQLKRQQYYIVSIKHERELDISLISLFKRRMSLSELAVACRQLAALFESGVTVVRALDILYLQATKKHVKEVIRKLYESVQRGELLSEAFKSQKGQFPALLVSMTALGEASGTLDVTMAKLAAEFEKDLKIRNKIIASMIYPLLLAIVAVIVVLLLVTFVLPSFVNILENMGTELPQTTRTLFNISNAIKSYWHLFLLAFVLLVTGIRYIINTDRGRLVWDSIKLKVPILNGLIVKIITSRFCHTMHTLLSSGASLIASIEILSATLGNRVYSDGLNQVKEDLRKGSSLAQAVRKFGKFPPAVASMINIGEESGALDSLMGKLADYYDNESDTAIQAMLALFEPLMIIAMSAVVGYIVISVITPIFSLYGSVSA